MIKRLTLAVFGACGMLAAAAQATTLTSPNGLLEARFGAPFTKAEGTPEGIASYALDYRGKPLIAPSLLSLKLDLPGFGSKSFKLLSASGAREVRETYTPLMGKFASVPVHYREMTLSYEDLALAGRKVDVVVRLYDQGAALRYVIHGRTGERIAVKKEVTTFGFARDHDCWGYNQGQWVGGHEGEYDPVKASRLRDAALYVLPLVCKTGDGQTSFALAESDVRGYPASFVSGRDNGSLGAELKHATRHDTAPGVRQSGTIAQITLPEGGFKTPWRVVMVGDTPGALVESQLVQMLATPTSLKDTSWIKPGKVAWDWWNGSQVAIAEPGMNSATYKAFVDFAAEMGLPYIMVDEGWSMGSSTEANPKADATRSKASMDMPAIVAYARQKGVGVWVWLQWQQLERQLEPALARYREWGIKGIKVDFMSRTDQEMMAYYERLVSRAAANRLMVDLHSSVPSNGLERTWPNLLTQEAVMGAEFNKWSARITATHNVTVPFTRMILGPMDYTPGAFRHVSAADFPSRMTWNNPVVKTTRGHTLGMYVVYDSPLQMVSDSPPSYKKADGSWEDGADFIRMVPTTWDETRVLQGDIGQFIVTARRKGGDWYLGAMGNEQARELRVPLDFLGAGGYEARSWQDGAAMNTLVTGSSRARRGDTLTLKLAPSGGAVVRLTAAKP
ncbi:MAG: glycoside hydrolase family 97 protein [Pseudomonadota bacterium]